MALSNGSDVFKMGISVAPVSAWDYYDSVYTERYMRTPAANPTGYSETSVVSKASNFKPNSLLLLHGTADDNVHFHNSAMMVSTLVKAGVEFEAMYYPNDNHAISSGNSRPHLYKLMTNFLQDHL